MLQHRGNTEFFFSNTDIIVLFVFFYLQREMLQASSTRCFVTLSRRKRPSARLPYLPLEQRPVEVVEGDFLVDLADANLRRYVLRGQQKLTDSCVQGQERGDSKQCGRSHAVGKGKRGDKKRCERGHIRRQGGGREETASGASGQMSRFYFACAEQSAVDSVGIF